MRNRKDLRRSDARKGNRVGMDKNARRARNMVVKKCGRSNMAFWDKVEIYRQQKNLTYRAIARVVGKGLKTDGEEI